MNYYDEIKSKILKYEIYDKIKNYSKDRNKIKNYFEIGKILSEAEVNGIPQVFRIWTWLTYFFIGGLVRKNDPLKKVDNKKLIVITFALLFVTVLYAYNFSNILYSNLYAENLYDSFIVIVTTFLIFNCFSRIQTSNKLITDIGKLNMGVYIIHPTIIKVFKYFNLLYNNYLNIIFSAIIFLICIIITKVISKIPYLNKIIKI